MQVISMIVFFLGCLLALIGWIWLVVLGFKRGGALWGILILLFNWLAGLVFCIMHKIGWTPLVLTIAGGILAVVGLFLVYMTLCCQPLPMP